MVIYLTERQLIENPMVLRSLKTNIEQNELELAKEYVQGLPILVSSDGKHGWNEGILPFKRLWLKSVAGRSVKLEDLKCNTLDELDSALTGLIYAELNTDHVRGRLLSNLCESDEYATYEFKDISFDIKKHGTESHVRWERRMYTVIGKNDEALKQAQACLLSDIRFCDASVIPYIIEPHDRQEPTLRRAVVVDGEPVVGDSDLLFWNTDDGYDVRNISFSQGRVWNGCPDGISPMTRKYWENLGLGPYYEYIARYRLGPCVGLITHDACMFFPNWTSGMMDMWGAILGLDYSGKKILKEVRSDIMAIPC